MRKYFNKINIDINPQYRDQLRSRVINEYYQKQTMDSTNSSTKKINFSLFKKLLFLSPIPTLVILGIFFLKKPATQNQPSNFLLQAQEVYAKLEENSKNKIHHLKTKITIYGFSNTTEEWENDNWHIYINTGIGSQGEGANKEIVYLENGVMKELYTQKEMLKGQCDFVGVERPDECYNDTEAAWINENEYCLVNQNDIPARSQELSEEEKLQETQEKIFTDIVDNPAKMLLDDDYLKANNMSIEDLGVIDNKQVYQIISENQEFKRNIKLFFNQDTYKLEKVEDIKNYFKQKNTDPDTGLEDIFIYEILNDEYIDADINDIPEFQGKDQMFKYTYNPIYLEDPRETYLKDKPTGCYNRQGELIENYIVQWSPEGYIQDSKRIPIK